MNATFHGFFEAEIRIFFSFQIIAKPPKFSMKEGLVVDSKDFLL